MDRHELELAAQYARDLCSRVGARAAEVGFLDGMITAKRHEGKVTRVNLEMFDPSPVLPDEFPAVLSYPEVSLVEARHILRDTLQETLERCIVRFGDPIWLGSSCPRSGGRGTGTTQAEDALVGAAGRADRHDRSPMRTDR